MKIVKTVSTIIAFVLLVSCTSNQAVEDDTDVVNKTPQLTEEAKSCITDESTCELLVEYYIEFAEAYNTANTLRTSVEKSESLSENKDKLIDLISEFGITDNSSYQALPEERKKEYNLYMDFAEINYISAKYNLKIQRILTFGIGNDVDESVNDVIDDDIFKEYMSELYKTLNDVKNQYLDGDSIVLSEPNSLSTDNDC